MTTEELKERFRKFSIKIIKMVNTMPNNIAGNAIAKQIVRSGTSPAANYRAACLAKSNKDFQFVMFTPTNAVKGVPTPGSKVYYDGTEK